MKAEIENRLRLNLARVRALVDVYQREAGGGGGRRPVETVDLLRAAVVFLHATLEDVLRTLLASRWPTTADPDALERVGVLVGDEARTKVTLADLLRHRGKTVDDLIRESILAHLERSSFNNVRDVKVALRRCGIDEHVVDGHASRLAAMMARRHRIVHRADVQEVSGRGYHVAASLGVGVVERWLSAVEAACGSVVAKL